MGQCLTNAIAFGPAPDLHPYSAQAINGHPGLVWLQSRSGKIPAIFIACPLARHTILYSHGNAEDIGDTLGHLSQMSVQLQANIMCYEYSGYSLSACRQANETNCYHDISAAWAYLVGERGIPRENIVLYGRSLGTGPTVDLASRESGLAGMVLQSPLVSAIGTQVGDGCCIRCLGCWDVFQNYKKIRRVNCPTLIMHGTRDTVVPCSNGRALFRNLRNPWSPLWCEGCGHNDMEHRMGSVMTQHLRDFMSSLREHGAQHLADQASDAMEVL